MDSNLEHARVMRSSGESLESVLAYLRAEGQSIIDSIKIVREVENIPLGEAKIVVDSSATWADFRDSNATLRQAAFESLDLPDSES